MDRRCQRPQPARPPGLFLALVLCAGLLAAAASAQEGPAVADGASEAPAAGPQAADLDKETALIRVRAEEWAQQAAEYDQARRDAPARMAALEAEILDLERREATDVPDGISLAELEAEILAAEQDLALARQEALEIDAEEARRADRRKKIPELLAAAKEKLRKLEIPAAPPVGSTPEQVAALANLDRLRRAALEAEILSHQNEVASYDARGQTLGKRRDRATLRIAYHGTRVERLRDAAKTLQRGEAERASEAALASLAELGALPASVETTARQLAEENARLAQLRTGDEGLVERIDDVSRKLARAEQQVAAIEANFANLAGKIEAAGLSDSVGQLLRRQRSGAPDVGKYRRFIRMREALVNAVQLQQIELRDQRRELADIDKTVTRSLQDLDASVSAKERREVEALLRSLYETQRAIMDALIADYETYFQKLVDFDAKQLELIDRTDQLVRFIDERILWIPSGRALRPSAASDARDALRWLLEPRYVGQLAAALRDFARDRALANILALLLLLGGLLASRRARVRISELADEARSPSCVRYAPTVETLFYTLLLVPWLPGLLAYLAWGIGASAEATQYARNVATAMLTAAMLWLSLRLPYQILRKNGLAAAHLGWPEAAVKSLRRHLGWLTAVVVPSSFFVFVFEARGEDAWEEAAGRIAFLVAMTAVSVFTWLAFRPDGPAAAILRKPDRGGSRPWVWRLVSVATTAAPVLLAVAALGGYYWTSLQISESQHGTVVFLFLLLVLHGLCVRWTLLAGRRVALDQAQKDWEDQLARRRAALERGGLQTEIPEVPEPRVDLAAVNAQTSRLLTGGIALAALLGLWMTWADVLPAAGLLSRVDLWSVTRTVSIESIDAHGVESFVTEERRVPITLADLVLALFIGAIALALVRNVPGLLDVTLFRRLGPGERYAYATIVRYAITLLGVMLAFDAIGVGWGSIQWLVAAIGLGLGFGLQEIFANFVSGLIILFERPIRVGDTVTVGDISGTVTRVRIRATWITGFDRKELVVPNKEFVTSRLINWSLSDAVLRVEIPVGIAYGSDTERAIAVLRRVADENELVLKDPPPQVLFLAFGDSALCFELRVFSPDVLHLMPIRHRLHLAIDRAFREAGIEIAFPQRDLHLRSVPPGFSAAPAGDGND